MFGNINPVSNNITALSAPPGLSSTNYSNLMSGVSGLFGSSSFSGLTGTGTDQTQIGDEASKLMKSMGLTSSSTGGFNLSSLLGGGGGDSTTSMIMMMMMMTMASSNNNMKSMMSQMSGTGTASATGTGTTGATDTSGAAAVTGAGKLDTTGVENKTRAGNGTDHTAGAPILESGTMKAGVDGKDGTAEITKDFVRADGKPSASNDPKEYKAQAGPVFENKCPCCGKKGVLSYAIGPESPEGSYFCDQKKGGCDVDYSILGGQEHVTSGNIRYLTKATGAPTTGGTGTTGTAAAGTASTGSGAGSDAGYSPVQINLPSITIPRDEENDS